MLVNYLIALFSQSEVRKVYKYLLEDDDFKGFTFSKGYIRYFKHEHFYLCYTSPVYRITLKCDSNLPIIKRVLGEVRLLNPQFQATQIRSKLELMASNNLIMQIYLCSGN